ncbi:MAG TPA: MgtC/SapB family protein [Acidimicrobiia bacterium]|nr:MgtC/SapB family protein [Acidimicrobiia bacterium]
MNHYGIDGDVVVRLLAAMACGAAVGGERELSGQTAGLRTHIAVCVGAALFGVVSTLGFSEFQNIRTSTYRADITRVASQVVVGVGFLGAGMILKRRNGEVANLTTAASIWTVAAVGLAAGVGDIGTAGIAAVLTLGYLVALRPVRRWMEQSAARSHCTVTATLADHVAPGDVLARLQDDCPGVRLRLVAVEKHGGRLVAVVRVEGRPDSAVTAATARIAALAEVTDLATQSE